MKRMRDITVRGRFHPQCQGCRKLVLERNGYDDVWNCCFYFQCGYQLAHSGRCIGTDNHEDPLPLPEKEAEYVGHA